MENNTKFDKNQILGFVLIALIFIGYTWFAMPEKDQAQQENPVVKTESVETPSPERETTTLTDTTAQSDEALNGDLDDFEEELVTWENNRLRLTFTTRGAQIVQAELKEYNTWDTLPLFLIDANHVLDVELNNGKKLAQTPFDVEVRKETNRTRYIFKSVDGETGLEVTYTLPTEGYMISVGMTGSSLKDRSTLTWRTKTLRHEKNLENERLKTTVAFYNKDSYDYLSERKDDTESLSSVSWVAHKQQFFSAILTTTAQAEEAKVIVKTLPEEEEKYTKQLTSNITLAEGTLPNFDLYLGPNSYETLRKYKNNYEKIIPLGWGVFGWINRGVVIPIFNWLDNYGLNYGLIILIMALLIKVVLFPLTYTSYKSMAKMRVLKPEIDKINEKFKDKDPMKKQQAVMKLYQETGVSPLGGCLPMFLQFPILIAIFNFFPSSIELRQQPFLWAEDLSTYDSIASLPFTIPFYGDHVSLFTLLMTVSTLIYTWMNSQMTGQNQQYPQLKYLMYLMPIMFLGIFNSYAAGLSYYYFVANIITFSQQWIIRSTIDDDALIAKLEANKQKPKKKSRFAQKMEEMAKQQQQLQKKKKR